ncbi:MAG: hypothetical protein Q9228_006472 [Teloschistes exilis]
MDDPSKDHPVSSDDIAQDYVILDTKGKTAYNGKPSEKEEEDALPEGWEEAQTPEGRRPHTMKFASTIVAVSALGSVVLAAPAPVTLNETEVEQVVKRDDYTLGFGHSSLKLVTYTEQGCHGSQDFSDSIQWNQNYVSDLFKSYYISRDLAVEEVLDFSGWAGRLIRRDAIESSPREESPFEKRELNPACVVFLQGVQGDGRKAGCHNTQVPSSCYRLWRHPPRAKKIDFALGNERHKCTSHTQRIQTTMPPISHRCIRWKTKGIPREILYMMLSPRLSLYSYLLLAFTILTDAHTLTLTVPSITPLLPASTRAHLTTQALTLTTSITTKNNFVFRNLTKAGSYNLDIYCRDWDFEPALVILQPDDGQKVEVFRRKPTGGKGARLGGSEADEGGRVELRVRGRREYYEAREGFSLVSMLKNPMILMGIVGLGMVVGMPYLLDNMDPEMRKEFEEQQQKSVLGNAAGGGNPLQSFDMAGWMAGQTTGTAVEEGGKTSGRDKGETGEVYELHNEEFRYIRSFPPISEIVLAMEKSAGNPQNLLLRLPYELRLHIYNHVFFDNNPDRIISAWKSESFDFWGPGVNISPPFDSHFTNLSLLRTCRAIYHDAKDFFYRSLTLQFTLDQGKGIFLADFWPREDARKHLAIPPASRKLVEKVEICIFFVAQHTHDRLQREWVAITNLVADDFTSLTSLKIEGPCKYTPWSLRDCMEGMFNREYSEHRSYIEPLLRFNRLQHLDIDHFSGQDTKLLLCGMKLEEVVRAMTSSTRRVSAMQYSGL